MKPSSSIAAVLLTTMADIIMCNPQSFFTKWWAEQDDATRELVKKMVREGQLDFVNGGYVQNDEAAAHFVAMIDQVTRGHRWVHAELDHIALSSVAARTGDDAHVLLSQSWNPCRVTLWQQPCPRFPTVAQGAS